MSAKQVQEASPEPVKVRLLRDIRVQAVSYGQIRGESVLFSKDEEGLLVHELHGAVCVRVGRYVFWTNLHYVELI
jgi:hypothetical protein